MSKHASTEPNLDFIRALAVILVVIDHTALALGYPEVDGFQLDWLGLAGVWIFFVHTALVLMWSLERRPFTIDFYIRRIFRIYPLADLAILTALATRAPLLGSVHHFFQSQTITHANAVGALLLVCNLIPPWLGSYPVINVVWSLPLEVEMYVLLPALFAFAKRDNSVLTLIGFWALAAALTLPQSVAQNFFTSIPNFICGVVAYVMFKRSRRVVPFFLLPAGLLISLAWISHSPSVPLGWIFTLALGLSLPFFRSVKSGAICRASHEIAKYSYGIYLIHPFALVLGVYLLKGHSIVLQLAVEVGVIAVVAVAAYHFVEKPMIDLGARVAAHVENKMLARIPGKLRPAL